VVAPAVAAATAVVGSAKVDGNCPPLLASEDFGTFLRAVPSNYTFIGSGISGEAGGTPQHNPQYEFNDDLLALGGVRTIFQCGDIKIVNCSRIDNGAPRRIRDFGDFCLA
jgi:metal-dependent amidase/aminoacylase/carboxypeptidase family protein